MTDYARGWKSTHSSSPFFRRIEKRTGSSGANNRPGRSPGRFLTILKGIFRWLFQGRRSLWKKVAAVVVFLGLLGFILLGSLFVYYSFTLPDPNKLVDRVVPESTKIFDRNGKLLYEIHGEAKRTLVTLDQIPPYVREASIAVEDKNFYKHGGISFVGIARSILVDIFTGSLSQGGSTITQQFVRNAVLTREKAFARKIKEIILSLEIERKFNKDQILQLYLNEIPYGSNAYGVEAASQTFFGKDVKDLTLTEAAYLAAIPKGPTFYSPYGPHKDELDARAKTVLQLMYEQSYITKQQRDTAQNQKVSFRNIGIGILAPHFVLYVQDLLAQKYGDISLQEGGLKVTTTLDYDIQKMAEDAVAKQVPLNEKNYNGGNAALVAIDPKTGEILAMVGSRDYFDTAHDGAVNVTLRPRQPGSSFKPYVYATAFKQGMNPATMLMDVNTDFGRYGGQDYTPTDYDGKERGPVSIRQALQNSLNVPAVKTMILNGVDNAIDTAEAMGITTLTDRSRYGPSLVLGGGEVKLLDHVSAYGVFAANGIKHDPVTILKVEDKNGNILEQYQPSEGREALNPLVAYQVANVLSDKQARSLLFTNINNKLTLPDRPVAAKTGTTQEFRDAWTVGFTPSLVAGVWVGNNDNAPMKKGADGLVVAAPIWNDFMHAATQGKPVENFIQPDGMIQISVDALSGKLPTAYTPSTKTEVFTSFNVPTQPDDVHLAGGLTVLHSEKPDDPAWENPVRDWLLAHGYSYQPPTGTSGGAIDNSIALQIVAPSEINSTPWSIQITAQPVGKIAQIQVFLDNNFLGSAAGSSLDFNSSALHVDGTHQLLAVAQTTDGKTNQKSASLQFAFGKNLVVIQPRDDQALQFPTNMILESTTNIAAENVKFWARSAAGKLIPLPGNITKQELGQIFEYTLNVASTSKPARGSYALYAQIGSGTSNEVTVKIP
jgi:1A family penicillin-binding protein